MVVEWDPGLAAPWVRRPAANDDKYRRGVLGIRTGSAAFPGAAVLGVTAAWRTGAGLVRFVPALDDEPPRFGLPTPAAAVLLARPETVVGLPEGARVDAWLVGSGTDPTLRSTAERRALEGLLAGEAPVVVDASALRLGIGAGDTSSGSRAPRILTPHSGEFASLWESLGLGPMPGLRDSEDGESRAAAAVELAGRTGAAVLLKGSTSVCATPGGACYSAGPATPWLATAGTGDVLAGILGALVAGRAGAVRDDPELLGPLGATAALLHDLAARIAAGDHSRPDDEGAGVHTSGGPIAALDVAGALPSAVRLLLGPAEDA
ncbi:ADP-dependent NAD(P)H-hydrate dehydratase [Leucobacter luti]|uniref:ADP-dependent NAD(P)H-hydrate dehydratase n=1 Tax=Leucobacter luti TaxID=340320 RepID=UPI003D02F684